MKTRLLNLLAILMVTMMSVNFMSCSSDDKEDKKEVKIEGTWLLSGDELIYVFNSDGTGYGIEYVYRDGKMVITDRWDIAYVYDENKGTLVYIEVGDTEVWDVIALTESSLVVREQGENRTLTFIRQENPDLGTITSGSGLKLASVGDYKLTYNSDGRLKGVSEYDGYGEYYRFEFSYNPNKISVIEVEGSRESFRGEFAITYNDAGYITRMVGHVHAEENWDEKFTYDKDGHLVRVDIDFSETDDRDGQKHRSTGVATFTWSNGKLLTIEATSEEDKGEEIEKDVMTWTCIYNNDIPNKYLQYGPIAHLSFDDDFEEVLAEAGCFGKGSASLPTSIIRKRSSEYENRNYSFTYTFNDNGSLNSYLRETEGSSSHTQFYSYYDK